MFSARLTNFAIRRVKEREGQLTDVSPELLEKLRRLSQVITSAPPEMADAAMGDFLRILDGVPAQNSLPVLIDLLGTHREVLERHMEFARGSAARVRYLDRLQMLAELFSAQRVARISETARYLEAGY